MAKFYAVATRDFSRTITMGALVVTGAQSGIEREIAPPRVHSLPYVAGTVAVFKTKRARDAHVAAINAEHPGALVPA